MARKGDQIDLYDPPEHCGQPMTVWNSRININAHSWSITLGGKNTPHYTRSSTGRRTTSMNLPGGFGYRRTTRRGRG